jgi:vacuolar-type H+-ATPase subunit I/STV1
MNTGTTRNVMLGLAAVTVTLMAGCANESASRRDGRSDSAASYQTDLDRAAASIAAAEREGATEHGGADLTRARDKLNEARRFADAGNEVAAQRLAVEAGLDAEVALATERNATAQAAVNELNESIRTLQDELQRNEQRSGSERL